ncbi:MAG: DUF3786 domain-containing protein [Lachnospiraceae bacterium]|nr:DUF3786 domain-containing protein [Lachnospiraceae bacterium]
MCGNEEAMAEKAKQEFLAEDQEKLIRKYALKCDEEHLYINFLSTPYAISRKTGDVTVKETGEAAVHDVMMAILDMLVHSKDQEELPALSGTWATLSTLGGIIGAAHVARLHTNEILAPFVDKIPEFTAVCEKLNGKKQPKGDVSYILPLFDFFPVWVQFYDADDEFPATLQFMYDSNAKNFVFFETLFYCTSYMEQLFAEML